MILGVDIGGSHITVACIDIDKKEIIKSQLVSVPVDSQGTADDIIDRWVYAIKEAKKGIPPGALEGIGIAIPGPFDYYNGIFAFRMEQKYDALFCMNIKEILVRRLELSDDTLMRFYNDAACFGIGEVWKGKLKNIKRGLAITLGTGFGASFLFHGLPIQSGEDIPKDGELYHVPFKAGIADDYFSTRWFVKKYAELTGETIAGVKELTEAEDKKLITATIFKEFSENLAQFLAPWLLTYEASALVIGGNIANAWNFFYPILKKELEKRKCYTELHRSELQEDAILLGSARLVNDIFYKGLSF
ncbi:ROK family protein [Aquimarina hainanensis]|uniref:ROK family protein n=2 Tax=Aquimarina TaxID=290174 RepID=A0ABW5N8U6_9FLAO